MSTADDSGSNETRRAHWDGTTGFERVLPGPDRMYPDTDLPPKEVTLDRIEAARAIVGVAPWEVQERIEATGQPHAVAWALTNGPWTAVYESAIARGVGPRVAASVLVNILPGLVRRGLSPPPDPQLDELLDGLQANAILLDAVAPVLREMALGGGSWREAAGTLGMEPASPDEAAQLVTTAVATLDRAAIRTRGAAASRAAMGSLMGSLRGRVAGARIHGVVEGWLGGEV